MYFYYYIYKGGVVWDENFMYGFGVEIFWIEWWL